MPFFGAVEGFSRNRITGWARCDEGGARAPITLELRLHGHAPLAPSATHERAEGTGFIFELPESCRAMPWAAFVDAYDGVVVQGGQPPSSFRVAMYKSVLLGAGAVPAEPPLPAPANPTTLLADRLRAYSSRPVPGGRVAAFTLSQGDPLLLGLWARHHAASLAAADLYVLVPGGQDPGGQDPGRADIAAALPVGVNRIAIPMAPRDGWQAVRMLALFQRFLLESYDCVVLLEPDMLLCVDPGLAAGRTLAQVLAELPAPVAAPTAWKLWHDIEGEAEYDPTQPLMAQRRILARDPTLDRSLIARLPMNWRPGLAADAPVPPVAGLHALHLRTFDFDHTLIQAPKLSGGSVTAEQIVGWFRTETRAYRATAIMGFDPNAPRTMAPDWMSKAIMV